MCLAAALAALLLAWPAGWALADEQADSATTEVYLAPGEGQGTQSASLGGGTAATTGTGAKGGTSAKTGDGVPAAPIAAAACAAAAVAAAALVSAKRRAASDGAVGGGDPR